MTEQHRQPAPTGGRPDQQPRISVVVLNKDEPELDATLQLLTAECAEHDAECVVIDASEGRLDWIREHHPWVRWLDYRKPFGLASSIPQQRNTGVRTARGEIIAFCDAGGAPEPGWLGRLVAPILDGQARVTCGPVRSTRPGVYRTINDLPDGTVVEHVLTANLAFTRAAFEQVDGFDERYAYGSDMDFAWRLIQVGAHPISVQAAVMGMDWGAWSLQRKRSWRYGRARGRLLRFHPARRRRTLLEGPEVIVYPLMVLGLVGVVFWALLDSGWRRGVPAAGWLGAALVLRGRQRHEARPWSVLLSHVIYSTATLTELLSAALGRVAPIGHTPHDPGPYQDLLIEGLAGAGVASDYIDGPTRSATVNVLLMPFRAIAGRLRGRRIHHLHWAHEYSLVWARHRVLRGVLRAWFGWHLKTIQAAGTKLVWTAHNVLPHETIFDNDTKARRTLVRYTDAIIAHNDAAAAELRTRFGARNIVVIPQGPYPLPATTRTAARSRLGIDEDRHVVVMVGRINTYKGTEDLLTAAVGLGDTYTVLIAGAPQDDELGARIEALADVARTSGTDVRTDLRHLDEHELAAVIAAADLVVFPFKQITNSGSVVLALSAGRAALVRDLPALEDLPTDTVLRYTGGPTELRSAITAAFAMAPGTLARYGTAAEHWSAGRSWIDTGEATRRVYEDVLAGRLQRHTPPAAKHEIIG